MRTFFKKASAVFLILVLSFTNVPFDAITGLIKGYWQARNVVDKMAGIAEDDNVVDRIKLPEGIAKLKISEAYAAAGDGRINYGQSTSSTPQTRFYTNTTNTYGSAGGAVAGTANVGWVVSKESPTEDLTVMATQSTTGVLDVFCRNSAGTWSKDFTVTIGSSAATRRFDVEFEKTTGTPMVLYSRNVATTNELGYRRKTSSGCGAGNWTSETTLNPTRITGTVLWVELERRNTASTNVMAAAFSDTAGAAGGTLESMIWDGSAWGSESPAAGAQSWSDSSIELQGAAGANAAKVFDLAFETNSGDLIVAWGTSTGANGTNGWRYATCAATLPCTWSAIQTPTGPTDDATNVAAAPDPGSDAVAFIGIGNAGSDLTSWTWTGSAVTAGTANVDTSTLTPGAGLQLVDIDWVVSGSQRMGVGVYANSTTGFRYVYYDTVGASWRTNTNAGFTVTGAPATAGKDLQVVTNPNNTAQLMFAFTDANSDLWSKRLAYNGSGGGATTALSTWSNSDGGSTLEGSVSSIVGQSFWFDWQENAGPVPDLTSYTNDTDATLNFSACGTTGCGARIGQTVTLTGTNFGTPSNRDTCTSGATNGCVRIGAYTVPAANISVWNATTITFTIPAGITTYGGSGTTCGSTGNGICVTQNANSDSALEFWVFPDITSISPSGAGEAKEGDSVTITGTRFETTQGTVSFNNCGTTAGSVTGWNDTTITVTVPSGISDNDDSCDVVVTRAAATGSKTDTSTNFVVLPKIVSLTTCSGCSTNGAREHASGVDTDGLIMVNGNHFGTSQGTGSIQFTGGLGNITGTVHATVEGPCSVGGWAAAGTSVCVEVSTSISDSVSSGTLTLTRTGDAKTNVWSTLFIIGRITSLSPTSGIIGTRVKVTGNHLCQGVSCPTSPNRSTLGDYVKFGTTQALDSEFVNSGASPCSGNAQAWTFTEVCVKVPVGTPSGSQPITVSHGTISNASAFTVLSTIPSDPSSLNQYRSDGTTAIPAGDYVSGNVILKANIMSTVSANLVFQVEVVDADNSFICSANTSCGAAIDGTIGGGGACNSCTTMTPAQINIGTYSDLGYIWQARVHNTTTDEYSNWVPFGNLPDFIVDSSAPTITFPSGNTCTSAVDQLDSNSARISWTLNEIADGQIQYSTNSDLSSSTNYPVSPAADAGSHQITLSGLSSGTTYYFKVKSTDGAGNLGQRPTSQPYCSLTTVSVTQPNKTTEFFIVGNSATISALATTAFSVITSETSPAVKSAFVELTGISNSPGTNSIQVQVNSQTARTYVIDAAAKTTFKIYYEVSAANLNLNDSPSVNVFKVTPSLSTYIVSAKIHVNYAYTP